MTVLLFKPQFAPLVEAGTKLQTIRPVRKRPIPWPCFASLRAWTGRPYASKQRELREVLIQSVETIIVHECGVEFSAGTLPVPFLNVSYNRGVPLNYFARDDGFSDWRAMRAWFEIQHGLPFTGQFIKWSLLA